MKRGGNQERAVKNRGFPGESGGLTSMFMAQAGGRIS